MADLTAGVTVGLVALPLALAFAISSGLTPQAGIYTAVVAGALISLLGGSRLQIGGPTGAFVVIVAGIVAAHGVEGLFVCTLMAGVMLVVLGATGMGSAVRFIPRPVVVGFTNGIAVLIASTQIRDFFGLNIQSQPSEFLPRIQLLLSSFSTWSPFATGLAIGAVGIILVANRVSKRDSGRHHRAEHRNRGGCRVRHAGRNDRHEVRRHSLGSALPSSAEVPHRVDRHPHRAGHDGGHARRDRVADVCDGRRPHERRPARLQRGAGRPGRGQHRIATVWRFTRNGCHRSNRHQHPVGCTDSRRRNHSCADARRAFSSSPLLLRSTYLLRCWPAS